MRDERIFDTLRPDSEQRTAALPPHQLSHPLQGFIVDDVEREQGPSQLDLGVEPLETCAALHGGEINEADRARGLFSDVQAHVGFIHGRDRMPLHDGMAVEAINAIARRREEVAERL